MKKSVVIAVLLLLLPLGPAQAFHLTGELAYVSSVESQYHAKELAGAGVSVSLATLGMADLNFHLRVLGSTADLRFLGNLYLGRMTEEPTHGNMFVFSDALLSLSSTWVLTEDMRLLVRAGIGDAAYVGAAPKSELSYNIYRGLRVEGVLGKRIAPGAELFAGLEYGPHLRNVFGTHASSSAAWREVELGLKAHLSLGEVRGGVRVSSLRESHDQHRFAGVFLSGGFAF